MDSQNAPVADTDHRVPLVDVSGLSLAELRGDSGEGPDDPHDVVSAFGSFVSDE